MNVQKINDLFREDVNAINLGVEGFGNTLRQLGARATQVDWKPPAGGDVRLIGLFDRLEQSEARGTVGRAEANEEAVKRVLAGKPTLIDIGIAEEVVPGMHKKLIMHAGPPVTWEKMAGPLRGAVIGGLIYEGLAA